MSVASELRATFGGKRVFVTGHTGFKGSWLTLWLERLGAKVTGYSLPPETAPSAFAAMGVAGACEHVEGDLRDVTRLRGAVEAADPHFVFHLAAQALVRRSYDQPVHTWEVNVLGTANLLEVVRLRGRPCAMVVVTSDKCYENREQTDGYREDDALGGHDPYSSSKAACELLASTYRRSYFAPVRLAQHGVALATARAGNVIGGGDWAADRIIPDAVASLAARRPIPVRNPGSIRPWQHVLEPLAGYLSLASRLAAGDLSSRARYCDAWNFGPDEGSVRSVRDLVERLIGCWGGGTWEDRSDPQAVHEGKLLRLSIDKATRELDWRPRWSFDEAVARTVAWYRAFADEPDMAARSRRQIDDYEAAP